jgi:hypothetical protein
MPLFLLMRLVCHKSQRKKSTKWFPMKMKTKTFRRQIKSWTDFSQWRQLRQADDDRVTRLGEFSPFGRLFILGSSLKTTKVAQILRLPVSTVKVMF